MQKQKAFTLVELMVAMAIIAVLIGMSVFGISTAQRILRDNQRRDVVKNIAAGLNSYYATNSAYPSSVVSASAGTQIQVSTGNLVPTAGVLKVAATTTAAQTRYCYALVTDGYKVGAKLEDGTWFNLGSASALCSDSDPAVS
jgi:prepilin-type N-terminal cleavage/methylation domain-containing protein